MLLGFALSFALVALIAGIRLLFSSDGPWQRRRHATRIDRVVQTEMRDLDRRLADLLRGVEQVD